MSVPTSFKLVFTMQSDWHVGLGAGRHGAVDSVIRRDWEGFPYIPGKTCVGILRDACEVVAEALGSDWPKLVDILFGSQPALSGAGGQLSRPIPAALQVGSARYPEGIRKVLRGKPVLLEALTILKPGVQIERETGTAKEDFLRYEEMARRGDVLEAKAHLDLSGYTTDVAEKAFALLLAGSKFAERIGGKRRRGTGRCTISIRGHSMDDWKDHLSADCSVSLPTREAEEPQSPPKAGAASGGPEAYALHITAESPLVIMSRVVGNVVETLDFIPGAFLLPIIGRRMGADTLARAVAEGRLRITHAYPVVDGKRGLPVPYCLFEEKMNPKSIHNRFWAKEAGPQLKACRDSFVRFSDGKVTFYRPKRTLVTHNVVDDAVQRPLEAGVYSFQSIMPGSEFKAYLILEAHLADGLDGDWGQARIGTAKHSEYGVVTIRAEKIRDAVADERHLTSAGGQEGAVLQEPDVESEQPSAGSPEFLTVWLLSDALLRNRKLRPMPSISALEEELESSLGVQLQLRQAEGLENAVARQRRIESWQTQWGLPRPTLLGLQAGTVAVFEVKNGKPDAAKLKEIERLGIGERTSEGYGRIAFDHPFLCRKHYERAEPHAVPDDPQPADFGSLSDEEKKWISRVQMSALRSHIASLVLAKAADRKWRRGVLGISGDKPSNTQLNALRVLVLRLSDDASNVEQWQGFVSSWKRSLDDRNRDRELWPQESLSKIVRLLDQGVWDHLGGYIQWNDFCVGSRSEDEVSELKNALWPFALKSLVDAVVRAELRSRSGGEQDAQEDRQALRSRG